MRWQNDAACRGLTNLMFPELGDQHAFREARALCDTCPVRRECLDWAMTDAAPTEGVLAGLAARERGRLRRQMRSRTPATPASAPPRVELDLARIVISEDDRQTWTRGELLAIRAAHG